MRNTIFMVMPFSDAVAASVYRYSTKPVAESHGFAIQRADEIFSANPIFDDIVTAIEQSSLVIVDISGRNANCFYELGVSHTLKRNRTIMITHDEFKEVPFDVAHFRILRYEDSIQGKAAYEAHLAKTLKSITSNLAELYHPEFEVIVDLLVATDAEASIYACQALSKASTQSRAGTEMMVYGRNPQGLESGAGGTADGYFAPMLARGLVERIDDAFSLTSKGNAFVEFVTAKGFVVDEFNDEKFSVDHQSIFDRPSRRSGTRRRSKARNDA
jgi:hypothetical protein